MKNLLFIVKQEHPYTDRPYRIVEVTHTIDGPRSRLSDRTFMFLQDAKVTMQELEDSQP